MNDTNVGFFLHLFLLGCRQGFRANNSEEFTSLRTRISDLRLERNFLEFVNINLQELEIFFISDLILESKFSLSSSIGEIFD